MNLPTQQQCRALWDKYQMPDNIRQHTEQVTLVADKVAAHIRSLGLGVDLELVNRGALLHDITKWQSVPAIDGRHHGESGADVIGQAGFSSDLGRVIVNHAMQKMSFDLPIEDQIVNYADKRVRHNEIVSLDERIADIKERYPEHAASTEKLVPVFYEFERKYKLI